MSNLLQAKLDAAQKKKATEALWRKGNLHWQLDSNQVSMREFIHGTKERICVIMASRQLGKSHFLVTTALETAYAKPNTIVIFMAPELQHIKNIVIPLVNKITESCPADLKPKYSDKNNAFKFHNNSVIRLAGHDKGRGENVRGTAAHLCIVDEAGFFSDLTYLVNSILLPTTTTTDGKIILSSTPPRSPDHDFNNYVKDAELSSSIIKRDIYANPRLSEEQIEQLAKAQGGKESVDFRREYLLEMITDEKNAVIPEFNAELQQKIVKDWDRPPFYDYYVSMDIGGTDRTAVVFAYYDFRHAKLVIVDEYLTDGQVLTDDIARNIAEREKRHFSALSGEVKAPYMRISDNNNVILLNDLNVKHGISFIPTLKDNKEAQLNNMRLLLKSESIIIHPRCVNLINHLASAVWDKSRKKYARSADKGHYDMVDALLYLCRNVNFSKNPYPANYSIMHLPDVVQSPTITPTQSSSSNQGAEAVIKSIFAPRKFGRRR